MTEAQASDEERFYMFNLDLSSTENFPYLDVLEWIENEGINRDAVNFLKSINNLAAVHTAYLVDDGELYFVHTDYIRNLGKHVGSARKIDCETGEISPFVTFRECGSCGEWHDEDEMVSSGDYETVWFCDYGCAEEADYSSCSYCGELLPSDSMIYIERNGGSYCSETCAENDGNRRCDSCGEWHDEDETEVEYDGEIVCDECRNDEDRWVTCSDCGTLFDAESRDGECPNCGHSENSELHPYGWTPDIRFYGRTDDNTIPYLGVELETDDGGSRGNYVKALAALPTAKRFWMTADGSLDDGVEITSQPMTLGEHIECGLWESVVETARDYDFTSHDNGRCGLHIHVNRDFFGKSKTVQEVGGYKMIRLLQRFEQQATIFSRRSSNRWCSYKTYRDFDPKTNKERAKQGVIRKSNEMVFNETAHSQAVNFEHRATFEIRIFRGTLKLQTFYASLAFAQGLARAAKCHGEVWVENCTWYEFCDWVLADLRGMAGNAAAHLENYLNEKGLYSNSFATSGTDGE